MLNSFVKRTALYRQSQDDCETREVTLVQERQTAAVQVAQLEATITALTDALDRERHLHDLTRAERDDYQQRFIDKCEYIALSASRPPFAIVDAVEATPAVNKRLTRAEIEARQQQEDNQAFLEWLMLHPEEASRYEQ